MEKIGLSLVIGAALGSSFNAIVDSAPRKLRKNWQRPECSQPPRRQIHSFSKYALPISVIDVF